ncbi:anti-sigma factor [Bacillus cereus group sp. BfR-BA-01380]|uniref:anti-sigma factor n=1 Tax=Bacillus cereus group sp. BfR-BA-01380 TaxID=2920324 RepID=UPI001F5AEFAA|nr:anti-sigma factor [Bacillus cereus group sp. BfR-BA-01380]
MSRKDFDLNMDDKQMKALMKKAKRKHLLRNWIISICTTIIVLAGTFSIIVYFTQENFKKMDREVYALHGIQGPNMRFYAHTKLSMGVTGGTMMYSSYKNIAGQPVKWIDEIYEYSIWGVSRVNHNGNTHLEEEVSNKKDDFEPMPDYNIQTMQREMRFYLPFMKYVNYVNDLENIGEMKNKVAEVALSFDKVYTAEQVVEMLPKDIRPAWFWVDTYDEKKGDSYVGLVDPESGGVLNAEMSFHVFGFEGSHAKKMEDVQNDIKRNSEGFLSSMRLLTDDKSVIGFRDHYRKNYQEVKNIPPKDLPIYGIVVTGTTESLKQLQGAPYVKAAVRGVMVDKQ